MSIAADLTHGHILKFLAADSPWRSNIRVVETTGSTNADLLAAAAQGVPERTILVAEHQTAGRGRLQRIWSNNPGRDLIFSLLLRPRLDLQVLPSITLAVGLAVQMLIAEKVAAPVGLKWPNDVLAAGKKISGILCETILTDVPMVVVGIGINVNTLRHQLPEELRETATSLQILTETVFDRGQLLVNLLSYTEHFYRRWMEEREMVFREWEKKSAIRGKTLTIVEGDTIFQARAEGLDEWGRLAVDVDGRRRVVGSGEIILPEE